MYFTFGANILGSFFYSLDFSVHLWHIWVLLLQLDAQSFCVSFLFATCINIRRKENLDTANKCEAASLRESRFHLLEVAFVMSSKQLTIGRKRSRSTSNASCLSAHLLWHIAFSFFLFSSAKTESIQKSKAGCHLGELLKLATESAKPAVYFSTSWHKGSACELHSGCKFPWDITKL